MKSRAAIRSLFLPVSGSVPLLLPSAVLAEVISYRAPESLYSSTPWLLGWMEWRGISVPLISFEMLCGHADRGAIAGTRIAILNGITGHPKLPFLGLRIQGIPRLTLVREESLVLQENVSDTSLYAAVDLSDQPALIPDLEVLEGLLVPYLRDDVTASSET